MSNQQIAAALAQNQKRYLAHMRERQGRRTAGIPVSPNAGGRPAAQLGLGWPSRGAAPTRQAQPSPRVTPVVTLGGPARPGAQMRSY
jgi:hypothetical protein